MPILPPKRKERLAINLFDLDATTVEMRVMLFGEGMKLLDLQNPIRIDPNDINETAIELRHTLLVGAAALDTFQSGRRKFGDAPAKLYIHRGQTWVRLPGTTLLTVVRHGRPALNPLVFGAEVITKATPLQPKRVM